MIVQPDPGEWIARACGGDEHAWAALYAEFRSYVYRAARGEGLDPADAEDVVQVVLGVDLPRKLDRLRKYEGRARLARWLERLAVRQARDMRRRRRRLALLREGAPIADATKSRRSAAERNLEINEQLARARLHLTATLWEPLVLRHLGGLSYAEMAGRLGVSEECIR